MRVDVDPWRVLVSVAALDPGWPWVDVAAGVELAAYALIKNCVDAELGCVVEPGGRRGIVVVVRRVAPVGSVNKLPPREGLCLGSVRVSPTGVEVVGESDILADVVRQLARRSGPPG